MGCYTIYVVREADGSVWWDGSRWGVCEFASPVELETKLAELVRRTSLEPIDASWCRGWYVDRGRRFGRVYFCNQRPDLDSERELREQPAWRDWDIGLAWDQHHEVSELGGTTACDDGHRGRLDDWPGLVKARLVTLHPDRDLFRFRWNAETEELAWGDYYHVEGTTITVIDRDGCVRDHGFDDPDVLFEALGCGPALLDELRGVVPCPQACGNAGAVIDEQDRAIRFWLREPIAPATVRELARRWPGWLIERERAGLAGHAQRSGAFEPTDDDPTPPYPELPARTLRRIAATYVDASTLSPRATPDDEIALLAAIAADPESDEPRQVYADLLLSRGDDRGTLINVQCELARLASRDEYSPRRRALEADAQKLLRFYAGTYGANRYRRGFLASASVEIADAERLLDEAPTIEKLELQRAVDAGALRALARTPRFACVRALSLTPVSGAIHELACPAFAGLRELALRITETAIANELAEVLAEQRIEGLHALELSGAGLDEDRLLGVLGRARLPALARLQLWSLDRLHGLAPVVGVPVFAQVTHFVTEHLDDAAVAVLVPNASRLRVLRAGRRITKAAPLLELPALAHLEVYGGDVVDLEQFARTERLARLRSLGFGGCRLTPSGVAALAASPHIARLRELVVARYCAASDADDWLALHETALATLRDRLGDALVVR